MTLHIGVSSPSVGSEEWKAQDRGPAIVGLCWSFTALSTIFVVARVYVRGVMKRKLYADDYFTLLAQICGYISTVLSTVAVTYGNGKHFSLLTVQQQEGAILWTTAAFCPGVLCFGLPKMAVIYFLTRLLNPGIFHKTFLWFIGIWCQLTLFATVGVLVGRCMPARAQWDFSVPGTCFDKSIIVAYCIYAGAYSAFVDLYLAIYPTVVLYRLQMPLRKKLAVCIALGIGNISGAVALYKTTRIPGLASDDFSYDTSDLVIWTIIEGSTIMIACSIPILRPLLDPFSDRGRKQKPQHDADRSDQRGIQIGERIPRLIPRDELGLFTGGGDTSQEVRCEGITHILYSDPVDGRITRTDSIQIMYENDLVVNASGSQGWRTTGEVAE